MIKQIIKVFTWVLLIIIAIAFLHSPGTTDVKIWEQWANNCDKYGLIEGYSYNKGDYPPLASVILHVSGQISKPFELNKFTTVKLSIFFFLLVSCLVFGLYTQNFLFAVILYVSLLLNSIMQGFLDVYYTPFVILSLWALEKQRITLFTVAFMITCLIKWQALIIAPFVILYLLNIQSNKEWKNIEFKNLIKHVFIPAFLILISVVLVFNFYAIKDAFIKALTHKHLSGFALNLNWMYTYILHKVNPDQFGWLSYDYHAMSIKTRQLEITLLPRVIFIVVYFTLLFKFFKAEKRLANLLLFSILGYLAYFLLNVGVHENHLFLIVVLSIILLWLDAKHIVLAIFIILMNNINLWIFYGFDGRNLGFTTGIWPVSFMLSFLNLLFFLIFVGNYIFQFNVLKKIKQSLRFQ